MKIEIKSRWNASVLFSLETESVKLAVEAAVKSGADLRGADLYGADLYGADLRGANLYGADLRGANLYGVDLYGVDLPGADLYGADLRFIRDDLWAVLSAAPAEVIGLRAALAEGRIDGSTYEGSCVCLVGTLANVRGCAYNNIPMLKPDSRRPSEVFFATIKPGDTPDKNANAKLALEWIDTWLANMRAAFQEVK